MLPSFQSHLWAENTDRPEEPLLHSAFENVALVEAEGERLEALAICVAMREALETPGKTAALVTPDRKLARRVSAELERFGIHIDDTAGGSLSASQPAKFCRLALRAIAQRDDPLPMSSFFKSDLLLLGRPGVRARKLGELIELVLLRDTLSLPDAGDLTAALLLARQHLSSHADPRITALDDEGWKELADFSSDLSEAIKPLREMADKKTSINVRTLCERLLTSVTTAATDESGTSILFEQSGGMELEAFFNAHINAEGSGFEFALEEAPAVFDALLEGERIRQAGRTHPRLHIYGQLEARLQSSDLVILGSLNEGSWPQSVANDPFLNRPMKSTLGLPLPERRTGLAAHDFCQLSGCSEVLYTRSTRKDDAPSVSSRWLQRLETFLGPEESRELSRKGNRFLTIARLIDKPDDYVPILPPKPKPPVETRPKSLSITEIETWIRDPYSIYARHILKLIPLPPLTLEAGPALRGSLYHKIFGDFIKIWDDVEAGQRPAKLSEIADRHFTECGIAAEVIDMWRPRFDAIGEGFLQWEEERRSTIHRSFCEVYGKSEIGNTGFEIRGRADRIDVTKDGKLVVIDYKTGTHPSKKLARTLSPQLSLEGMMAKGGAFNDIAGADLDQLLYVRLREGEKFDQDDISIINKKASIPADELANTAHEELIKLILSYQNREQEYVSRYAPVSEKTINGAYDHLARVREWSLEDDPDSGDGDE